MTIKDLFKAEHLDKKFIEDHFDGSYWESASSFVEENWDREIDTMSEKQAAWATKIVEDCVEKRIEG